MSGPRIEREVPVVLAQWIDNTRFLRVGHLLPGLDEDNWDRMSDMGYVGALLETRRAKRGKRTITNSRHGLVPNRTGVPEVQNNWISHILTGCGRTSTRPYILWRGPKSGFELYTFPRGGPSASRPCYQTSWKDLGKTALDEMGLWRQVRALLETRGGERDVKIRRKMHWLIIGMRTLTYILLYNEK
ncbi:hypothetical protein DFH08DRAFT_819370 [Mycena albidolilacea]|uniref:Uncharacterized protein n=1 Tax=Mycena albidolilacea TaxID=1033008 RepID=A0AAD6ZG68_9AGAR|nr:hypothetical protein DFH08DRAFT_819370 [Mycena albidolilacea]